MRLDGFTDSGFFWLPDDVDRSHEVPGTLSVSESGGVTLETFGYASADPLSLAYQSWDRSDSGLTRIFGFTPEHGAITIIDGRYKKMVSQGVMNRARFSISGFTARVLLTGGHFAEHEPLFNRITFRVEGLDEWLDMSGITAEHDHARRRSAITFEAPEPLPFEIGSEVMGKFRFGYTIPNPAPWATEASVSQSAAFDLSTSGCWTTEEALRWGIWIRNFLCLATDAPVALTSFKGYLHGDQPPELPGREGVSIFFTSWAQSPEPATVEPWAMSFRRQDIGDLSGVLTNWVDACREWARPFGLFFSARYREGALSADLWFVNLVEAMETLALAKGSPKKESLRRRVERLTKPFAELLEFDDDLTEFSKRVTVTRNFHVHHDSRPGNDVAEGSDLIRLSWQCEALLICHLTALALGSDDEARRVLRDAAPILERRAWWKRG